MEYLTREELVRRFKVARDHNELHTLACWWNCCTGFACPRQYMDRIVRRYAVLMGIHPSKAHYHVLKHSIYVLLWQGTHDLIAIQDHVVHHSSSNTLVYFRADAALKAQSVVAGMSFGSAL
jgi:site-specific recombinase XerD